MSNNLNSLSAHLVLIYQKETNRDSGVEGIRVNQIVSEIASWYERIRNAMEYREDEVILRAAIERILKRRLILGGNGKTIANPLIRELIWARYFPDGSISERTIDMVAYHIDLYLKLRQIIISKHKIHENELNHWFYQVISSHVESLLNPHPEQEAMINYMFHILRQNITIIDDAEETRDAQVFIAVRKSYAKNDMAFIRYHLFTQFFGELTEKNLSETGENFLEGYQQIEKQLTYSLRFKIFSYIKRHTPSFLILDDIFMSHKADLSSFLSDENLLHQSIYEACQKRYRSIVSKVRRAIIRSVIFILLSKALFAFAMEGTYEQYFYGHVLWTSIGLNIVIPPLLMILVGFSIRTPDKKNTERILSRIKRILFDPTPHIGSEIRVRHIPPKTRSFIEDVLTFMWMAAFVLSFGLIIFVLTKLQFNPVSQAVFIFFLAIVTFLAYRINRTAHLYTVGDRQGLLTPVVDILFLPIAQVGRYLTDGISQVNIFLYILDFVIEAPFKAIFGFFEQLFSYLHGKREYLE